MGRREPDQPLGEQFQDLVEFLVEHVVVRVPECVDHDLVERLGRVGRHLEEQASVGLESVREFGVRLGGGQGRDVDHDAVVGEVEGQRPVGGVVGEPVLQRDPEAAAPDGVLAV